MLINKTYWPYSTTKKSCKFWYYTGQWSTCFLHWTQTVLLEDLLEIRVSLLPSWWKFSFNSFDFIIQLLQSGRFGLVSSVVHAIAYQVRKMFQTGEILGLYLGRIQSWLLHSKLHRNKKQTSWVKSWLFYCSIHNMDFLRNQNLIIYCQHGSSDSGSQEM